MTLRSKNHSLGSWGRRQKTVALWVASKSSFFSIFRWIWKVSRNDQNGTRVSRKLRVHRSSMVAGQDDGMLVFWNLSTVTFWLGGQFEKVRWHFGTYFVFEPSGFLVYFLHSGQENLKKFRQKKPREINKSIWRKKFIDQILFFAISIMAKNKFLNWGKSLKLSKCNFETIFWFCK